MLTSGLLKHLVLIHTTLFWLSKHMLMISPSHWINLFPYILPTLIPWIHHGHQKKKFQAGSLNQFFGHTFTLIVWVRWLYYTLLQR